MMNMKWNKKGGMMMPGTAFAIGLALGIIGLLALIYFAKLNICSMLGI